jgi:hypothetical protein
MATDNLPSYSNLNSGHSVLAGSVKGHSVLAGAETGGHLSPERGTEGRRPEIRFTRGG